MLRSSFLLFAGSSVRTCSARLLAFLLLLFAGGCASPISKERKIFQTVIVDPGHGGHDSGALGRRVAPEKVWTLSVAQLLSQRLTSAGFNVIMTRNSDVFIPLDERVAISNREPGAVFVSIHFNSSWKPYIRGLETYYYSSGSLPLAREVHARILQMPGMANRGVRKASFRVIDRNEHAAILVEGGFLSNSWEASRIAAPAYRYDLAEKICEGILAYRGTSPIHGTPKVSSPQPPKTTPSPPAAPPRPPQLPAMGTGTRLP